MMNQKKVKVIKMNKIFVNIIETFTAPSWFIDVEKVCQWILKALKKNNCEISVLFCDDEYMQSLNKQFRNIDSSTDILSFENISEQSNIKKLFTTLFAKKYLGDIAISIPMIKTNAEYFCVPECEELQRLLIHGVLHLCGYDHGDEHIQKNVIPQCEMLKLQEELLKKLLSEKIIKEE